MSTDTPTPERVTLTDEEQALIATAEVAPNSDDYDWLELIAAIEQILAARLAAREQALREEYEVAADEWANDYADWMANNPGPSGIPSDPPMLDTYLARGGAR